MLNTATKLEIEEFTGSFFIHNLFMVSWASIFWWLGEYGQDFISNISNGSTLYVA